MVTYTSIIIGTLRVKMDNLAILLKSFQGDLSYVERLIKSYHRYNKDHLPLHIVVPAQDLLIFKKFEKTDVHLHSDESITDDLVADSSVRGIRPGYINQEIVKLAFWEKKLCKNYFIMDSDGVFIRNFYFSDFMYDKTTPYTILSEDNELKVDPKYYHTYWQGREKLIRKIQRQINLKDNRMLTSHGFSIFSLKVLRDFYNNYLIPNNLTYADILRISPYECSWYNTWLQKSQVIPIKQKEPLFKVFHQQSHHLTYVQNNITVKDIARGYLGYCINSNYSRGYGVLNYEDYHKYHISLLNKIDSKIYPIVIKPLKHILFKE